MSPEQIRGSAEVDGRVDIYAFGVILYEALTGRVPFDGKTYSALVLEIATGTPTRPCDVNPRLAGALERVILKAMAREPAQRFQTMEELAKALAPFASGAVLPGGPDAVKIELGRTSGPATTPFVSEAPVVPVRRTPMIVAGAIGAGVLALALAAGGRVPAGRSGPGPRAELGARTRAVRARCGQRRGRAGHRSGSYAGARGRLSHSPGAPP
jgi:serine/threonine-protein kinase